MKIKVYLLVTCLLFFSGLCFYCGGIDWLILSGFGAVVIIIIFSLFMALMPKNQLF